MTLYFYSFGRIHVHHYTTIWTLCRMKFSIKCNHFEVVIHTSRWYSLFIGLCLLSKKYQFQTSWIKTTVDGQPSLVQFILISFVSLDIFCYVKTLHNTKPNIFEMKNFKHFILSKIWFCVFFLQVHPFSKRYKDLKSNYVPVELGEYFIPPF